MVSYLRQLTAVPAVFLFAPLLIEPVWWGQNVWPDVLVPQTVLTKLVFLSVPVVACIAAYAMWRRVEEPARKTMRAMTKPPARPSPQLGNGAHHTGLDLPRPAHEPA